MSDFKKLLVWQKAQMMVMDVHHLSSRIRGVKYGSLRSQIISAAMSVAANIVEGSSQQSSKQFIRFLRISLNSSSELEHHLLTARDLGAIREGNALSLIAQVVEVRKMLHGLIKYLTSH